MRISSSLDAAVVGSLKKEEQVEILERSAAKVTINGITDYYSKIRRPSDGLEGNFLTMKNDGFNYNDEYEAGKVINAKATDFTYLEAGKAVKPFLPGLTLNTQEGCIDNYRSLYAPDKIAGTDSAGMLLGSVAMTDFAGEVLSALNKKTASNIDNYYKMNNPDVIGLDKDDSKPIFYSKNDTESILNKEYRFRRSDIERNTVLVPDLCEVQEGDLLVKYNENGQTHIGVIVALGWKLTESADDDPPRGSDIRLYWDQIYVVSVRAGFQMVSLGKWGNPEGSFSGFTDTPELYQIRRILKLIVNEPTARPFSDKDPWELIKDPITKLTCNIELPNNFDADGTTNHWMPNTNDLLGPISITLEGGNNSGVVSLVDKYDITLKPPADQFFSKDNYDDLEPDNNLSNIYTNRGTGMQIWVQGEDEIGDEKYYLLSTYSKRNITDILGDENNLKHKEELEDKCYEYRIELNEGAYINNEGKTINGTRLYVSEGNSLVFEVSFGEGDNKIIKSFDKFYIKAIQDGNIRPGDDFLLKFGIEDNENVIAKADGSDFVAIYDKRLLWRANLYIDEVNGDWNNFNKWDSEHNECNKSYDGENVLNLGHYEPYLINLSGGGGRQAVIVFPSTWHMIDINENTNIDIENSVAYSVHTHDNPFEFSSKMQEQRLIIEYSMKNSKNNYVGGNNNSFWGTTLSPGTKEFPYNQENGKWKNYIGGSANITQIEGNTYYPYRPGFSSAKNAGDNNPWNATAEEMYQSAGVDCVGLLHRSASYNTSNYKIGIITGYKWTSDNWGGVRIFPTISSYLWRISGKDFRELVNGEYLYPKIEKIVPGDIVYYAGDIMHVMIVQSIEYIDDEERMTTIARIKLIEATVGTYQNRYRCYVIDINNINTYRGKDWKVGRLIVNN